MRKIIYTAVICLGFVLAQAQTVYIAETGKKYHTRNCPTVKTKRTEMSLAEAKKKGYEACPGCGADKIQPKEEKAVETKKEKK